jgi:hypothetical protein
MDRVGAARAVSTRVRLSVQKNEAVRHRRHYELQEARAELAWVAERLVAMRDARERLTDADARQALADGSPSNGGGSPGKRVGEAFVELQAGAAALAEREIVLRDLDRGLVDFPTIRDGREVYLCWIEGEPDIEFWHELDAGYAGREAL